VKLHPFLSVDDTPFSATWEEVQHARGKPIRTCRNAVGLNELDYDDVVFRFQDNGRLEEVTRRASTVTFGTVVVPSARSSPSCARTIGSHSRGQGFW